MDWAALGIAYVAVMFINILVSLGISQSRNNIYRKTGLVVTIVTTTFVFLIVGLIGANS